MNIAIIGYGKLGKAVAGIAEENGWTVVAKIKKDTDWDPQSWNADIAFESSTPDQAVGNVLKCLAIGLPVVIGTTGWHSRLPELEKAVAENSSQIFHATNFSLGVHLLNQISRYMTRVMSQFPEYSASIQESHHKHKLDSPSGTAITLANEVSSITDSDITSDIPIHSLREGNIVGIHELLWKSEVDVLALRHEAISRRGFALGAFQASCWLVEKNRKNLSGIYTMNDMISEIK
ncbi:MAG: 4-hydroxy-tetrahydrodipicolinate reductase [Bacteroidetes bacterium]|nr:MAG: 4-hydroxy-tetrahydrodipicolinate reductase [Bacteroidota bacterium]